MRGARSVLAAGPALLFTPALALVLGGCSEESVHVLDPQHVYLVTAAADSSMSIQDLDGSAKVYAGPVFERYAKLENLVVTEGGDLALYDYQKKDLFRFRPLEPSAAADVELDRPVPGACPADSTLWSFDVHPDSGAWVTCCNLSGELHTYRGGAEIESCDCAIAAGVSSSLLCSHSLITTDGASATVDVPPGITATRAEQGGFRFVLFHETVSDSPLQPDAFFVSSTGLREHLGNYVLPDYIDEHEVTIFGVPGTAALGPDGAYYRFARKAPSPTFLLFRLYLDKPEAELIKEVDPIEGGFFALVTGS